MPHTTVRRSLVDLVEHTKILKLLLDRKPDLTLKNRKGQTPINVANSKMVMMVFWHHLYGDDQHDAVSPKRISPATTATASPRAVTKEMRTPELAHPAERKQKQGPAKLSTKEEGKRSEEVKAPKWNSGNVPVSKEKERVGLDSFAPVRILGKGSFGEVFLVQRKSNKKLYAMKVITKQKVLAQNLVKYVYAEKHIQSMLVHPFIVRLHCAFQTQTRLFLVLDYCPGGDLGRLLQAEKRLHKDRARMYLCEVLLAIQELHSSEIVYRDLKPDNVVIDSEGHAMLTDFGLSKEGVKDADFTKSFCGSVAYLAPEVLRKSGHGRSVDWYLLGTLLYEMLVGIPPYFNHNK